MFDYPLLLKPINVPRPWGAGLISSIYDREASQGEVKIGEAWDVSTFPQDPGNPDLETVNVILNGPLAGKPLTEALECPVVVKILDTCQRLSVQIHPVKPGDTKDEMWYILNAKKDAFLYLGLKDGVEAGAYCDKAADTNATAEEVTGMLKCYDNLKFGDYFNVPSGTIHAVGPDIVAFEVSEQKQITYRLYDYNRGRALHLAEGKEAATGKREDMPILSVSIDAECDNIEYITKFPCFWVCEIFGKNVTVNSCDRPQILTAVAGDVTLKGENDNWNITVKQSKSAVIPAGYKYTTENTGDRFLLTPFKD